MEWHDVRSGNEVKRRLQSGGPVAGAFVRIPAVEIVEMLAHGGSDFVILDTEHTPVGWETVAAMVLAADASGTVPILRVPSGSRDIISRALDTGAHGVMVPQVEDAATAAVAVTATRYGPGGSRGAAGTRRMGYGMKMGYPEYVAAANDSVLTLLQIETQAGVDSIESIVAVGGIDCIFVGLTDLSVGLGHPGEYHHPDVETAVERVLSVCNEARIPVGVPASSVAMAAEYVARGVRLVAGSDMGMFGPAARGFLEGVRASFE
jgi:2-keto-3-deoxy-L-rhamnonate aldolase RhmA